MNSPTLKNKVQHWLYIGGLMLAGESIYMLPYMRKTFQTSMESVFSVTGAELGLLNSMFGALALLCYFPSGWVADQFSARKLLTFSLLTTGLGGFGILISGSYSWLLIIHALWGVTTILTFWSALIKATRSWGGSDNQGLAFGLLAAGRGVVAAILATIATALFGYATNPGEGLQNVIMLYSFVPILAAAIIWLVIPEDLHQTNSSKKKNDSLFSPQALKRLRQVTSQPEVWLLAIIIFTAYFIYIGTFDFPAFAERAYGQTKTFGASLGTIRDWMRPLAALGAGILADRFRASRIIGLSFFSLIITFGSLFIIDPSVTEIWIFWVQVIVAALAVFGIRGIYFAMLEEIGTPHESTGLTVGIISFIGFTPDVFGYWLSGSLTDNYGPTLGHQLHFGLLGIMALVGLLATVAISLKQSKKVM